MSTSVPSSPQSQPGAVKLVTLGSDTVVVAKLDGPPLPNGEYVVKVFVSDVSTPSASFGGGCAVTRSSAAFLRDRRAGSGVTARSLKIAAP